MVKGFLGFAVGIALLFLLHRDLQGIAEKVLDYLHVEPTGHLAQMFVERAAQVNESNIIIVVILVFLYTILRMVEAYGLWHLRPWAEWLAIISGGIYLPFEIYKIFQKPSIVHFVIFFGNVLLVLYLIYVRREAIYQKTHVTEPIVEVFKK